uniref:Uncharacterized protein n=1 Tax=Ciona intestinalis TaxID=7719 RepID=H2Y311_CIOIN
MTCMSTQSPVVISRSAADMKQSMQSWTARSLLSGGPASDIFLNPI